MVSIFSVSLMSDRDKLIPIYLDDPNHQTHIQAHGSIITVWNQAIGNQPASRDPRSQDHSGQRCHQHPQPVLPPPPPPLPDKDLSLQSINVSSQNCLAVGDFDSHSTSWGYGETDCREDEVEDWQIENNMLLLNDPQDPTTFFS